MLVRTSASSDVPFSATRAFGWDISSVAWNPDDAFFQCGCFIGDYNAIAASTQVVFPVWTDGRNSAGKPLRQTDIYTNVEIGSIP